MITSEVIVMKKRLAALALVLIVIPWASASVVINQVLYDPIGTESGGETVELRNAGQSAVDISGWVLATDSSAKDATIPRNTVLGAGETYLITDKNWSQLKDSPEWRDADYEEPITLGNTDSGVALLANGTLIDALGWGNAPAGLFRGTPASMVDTGRALVRVKETGNNSADFIDAEADFAEGIPVPVTAEVTISAPIIEVSKSLDLAPEGVLEVRNNGDAQASIKIVLGNFVFKNSTIPKSAVVVDGPLEFMLDGHAQKELHIRLDAPEGSVPGTYASTLHVIVQK